VFGWPTGFTLTQLVGGCPEALGKRSNRSPLPVVKENHPEDDNNSMGGKQAISVG